MQHIRERGETQGKRVAINIVLLHFYFQVYGDARFILTIMLVGAITFGYRLAIRYIKWQYYPDDAMIVAEIEANERRKITGMKISESSASLSL